MADGVAPERWSDDTSSSRKERLPQEDANAASIAAFGPNTPGTGNARSQTWIVISMFGAIGANRLSVDFDAAWLDNGCPPPAASMIYPATPATNRHD